MNYIISLNGKQYQVVVEHHKATISKMVPMQATPQTQADCMPTPETKDHAKPSVALPVNGTTVTAPLPGSVTQMHVKQGQKIKRGDLVCILEAMKMEHEITAPVDGVVIQVVVSQGSAVQTGDILIVIG